MYVSVIYTSKVFTYYFIIITHTIYINSIQNKKVAASLQSFTWTAKLTLNYNEQMLSGQHDYVHELMSWIT